jgi:4-hydroxy-tetrahydrodipicolinate synthase
MTNSAMRDDARVIKSLGEELNVERCACARRLRLERLNDYLGAMMQLSGFYTALVSPFADDGSLDEKGFCKNLKFQEKSGVDGVVIAGSTGEGAALTDAERERLVELAVERVGGRIQVIVGAGTNSTATTIERVKRAKALGADAALVVTPYYNKPTQKGIYSHFEAIAHAVDFPVIVYNHPGRTGVNIDALTMAQIAELPHVIGVKDSNDNINAFTDIIHHTSDLPFAVMKGDDVQTVPAMALGADGLISILGNLTPYPLVTLVAAMQQGDWTTARELHYRLLPLFKAMAFETNPIPIKAAMNLCNLPAGPTRLPLSPMSDPHHAALHQLLADAGLEPCALV